MASFWWVVSWLAALILVTKLCVVHKRPIDNLVQPRATLANLGFLTFSTVPIALHPLWSVQVSVRKSCSLEKWHFKHYTYTHFFCLLSLRITNSYQFLKRIPEFLLYLSRHMGWSINHVFTNTYVQMFTILHGGTGGSLGPPKSDFVICGPPLSDGTWLIWLWWSLSLSHLKGIIYVHIAGFGFDFFSMILINWPSDILLFIG